MATPTDVGDVCVLLASPLARYVTGEHIVVHGGGEWPAYLHAARAPAADVVAAPAGRGGVASRSARLRWYQRCLDRSLISTRPPLWRHVTTSASSSRKASQAGWRRAARTRSRPRLRSRGPRRGSVAATSDARGDSPTARSPSSGSRRSGHGVDDEHVADRAGRSRRSPGRRVDADGKSCDRRNGMIGASSGSSIGPAAPACAARVRQLGTPSGAGARRRPARPARAPRTARPRGPGGARRGARAAWSSVDPAVHELGRHRVDDERARPESGRGPPRRGALAAPSRSEPGPPDRDHPDVVLGPEQPDHVAPLEIDELAAHVGDHRAEPPVKRRGADHLEAGGDRPSRPVDEAGALRHRDEPVGHPRQCRRGASTLLRMLAADRDGLAGEVRGCSRWRGRRSRWRPPTARPPGRTAPVR